MLANSNIWLHKIASNHEAVMEAFPSKEHAKEQKDHELDVDHLPMQIRYTSTGTFKQTASPFKSPEKKSHSLVGYSLNS